MSKTNFQIAYKYPGNLNERNNRSVDGYGNSEVKTKSFKNGMKGALLEVGETSIDGKKLGSKHVSVGNYIMASSGVTCKGGNKSSIKFMGDLGIKNISETK